MRNSFLPSLLAIGLTGVVYLLSEQRAQIAVRQLPGLLSQAPLDFAVPAITQSRPTSCGEAVVAMAYNFAHPESRISERAVIDYAAAKGYFTESAEPYTSPASMRRIARNFAGDYSSGAVQTADQGLSLLIRNLQSGDPVIIDVRTRFDDTKSAAHFVLVTGILADPSGDSFTVSYNDPLTGTKESAPWDGAGGLCDAWQHNSDPRGSGWWLVIPHH